MGSAVLYWVLSSWSAAANDCIALLGFAAIAGVSASFSKVFDRRSGVPSSGVRSFSSMMLMASSLLSRISFSYLYEQTGDLEPWSLYFVSGVFEGLCFLLRSLNSTAFLMQKALMFSLLISSRF